MKTTRIGLLGCGRIQRKHFHAVTVHEGAEIAALCDIDASRIAWILDHEKASDLEVARYTSEAEFFAHRPIDAVVISTPHASHADQIIAAVDAGLDVLVEKPMVTNAADAERVIERVEQTGRQVQIGYNAPFTPELQYVRDCIRDKTFGRLQMVSGYISQRWKNYVKGSWREVKAISGGGFSYDSGAHPLNTLCWTIDAMPTEVFAQTDNRGAAVDVNMALQARFDPDILVQLTLAGDCEHNIGSFMAFLFEDGGIEVDGWNGRWIRVFDKKGPIKYPPIPNSSSQPLDHFIDAIRGKVEPLTSPRNGLIQATLMDHVYRSAETGLPVKVG
ncbi:Gfo/Idh/MocA family protein [Mucisphaera calidilacus]|uniref:Glucose--fructose oxidoreductase n=1 Tax=Mucisphaera calidilacus TaxID=2527982 RepID=A0A518BWJ2_9BACT|nr:Gfo/Idh/MocA family oxidoreductase [Mucisphaera calidilacus]QDU71345.1 Glucose--fructose oxidoreductase precursor [Mucisphaera calidilacus]